MKKTLLIVTALLLAACSSPSPQLVHTEKPLLNIESALADQLEPRLQADAASVKNISSQPLNVAYYLYWYDKNGVTQAFSPTQEFQYARLRLQPQQTADIPLPKPTSESRQYRLYLGSK